MKILLTNDDGFDSPGLQLLKKSLERKHDIWVVAPDGNRSGSSHSITLTGPIKLKQKGYGFGRPRIEDFVGAFSEDTGRWPDLAVDTSYLRTRYDWQGSLEPLEFPYYPYLAEIGALPEVGWAEPSPDAEIMYRYQSLYGDTHPIYPELSFQGNPVMHCLDRGTSRTVHGMFTPLALDATDAQLMVNAVLDWLYEPWIISTSQSPRQYLPTLKSTSVDLRSNYLEWRQEWSKLFTPSRTMSRGTK